MPESGIEVMDHSVMPELVKVFSACRAASADENTMLADWSFTHSSRTKLLVVSYSDMKVLTSFVVRLSRPLMWTFSGMMSEGLSRVVGEGPFCW